MSTSVDRMRTAISRAVTHSLETLAFLEATATQPSGSTVSAQLSCWSWVKVTEPCPGTVVLALPPELIALIGQGILGTLMPSGSAELLDSQAELTNIVAGRLVHEVMGPQVTIGLGLPRTGRGAPNVKEAGWIGQEFVVDGHHLAVYVCSEGLLLANPRPGTKPTGMDITVEGFDPGPAAVDAGGIPLALAGYRLLERLGEGGMGVVYKAHHSTLDRQAAMKVMRPELAKNERFVARFLREARTAAKIDHPNVVTVYDAGVQDGSLFIAMRFVPGGDLAQALRDKGPMPQLDAMVVIARCLMGLQAISDGGMIHRDIKPANILLELDGSPRLADLGLAKGVEIDDQLSQAGSVQGTPSFMSPEQARGNAGLDVRSDIYSLGATLYALLAGVPPFAGDSAYETVSHVLTRDPAPLSRRVHGISPEGADLVMRALAKDPERRPQTPEDFIDEISAIIPSLSASVAMTASGKLRTPLPEGARANSARLDAKTRSGEHWLSRWLHGRGRP